MANRDAAFVGSIPALYDRYLGPMFFHDFADAMAARLEIRPEMRVRRPRAALASSRGAL
jgi:hypothetical protein